MKKQVALALSLCILLTFETGYIHGQSSISEVLKTVEKNNIKLKALEALKTSKSLDIKASNNLPDPELSGFYLPFGDHAPGDYSEYQISQTFEFPSVYGARKSLINSQEKSLENEFQRERQTILLNTQNACFELVYLNKRIALEEERVKQAKQAFEHAQKQNAAGESGILELNKSQVIWLQRKFVIQELKQNREHQLLILQRLNGNRKIAFEESNYSIVLQELDADSIWNTKLTKDPDLLGLEQQQLLAEQSLKLAKQVRMPNITAGFNYQGIANDNYSGLYAGITIPLWSNRFKVKSAQAQVDYQEQIGSAISTKLKVELEQQINEYNLILSEFDSYQTVLESIESEQLLLESYQLGEISFITYYMEVQFYREALDAMLNYQKRLYVLQANLLKYNL